MKKILVFGITENPGGVESVIMNYYRNIDRTRIQFDFLCNSPVVAYEEEIKKLGGSIYRITARSNNRKKFHDELNMFFKNHSNEYCAIWVNVCSLANIDYLIMAKKYGIKCRIIHSHNSQNMDSFLRKMLHMVNKFRIKKYATDFWSCSKESSEWFYSKKIINGPKYQLINNAIDLGKYQFDEKIRKEYREKMNLQDNLIIGNIARFHFQKNHPFIIKIFSEIVKLRDNARLVLVGQGEDQEKIKIMVKEEKLEDKVIFLGVRNDVDKLIQAMDVFIFPSLFEGIPVTLIEAQASGIPILASEEGVPVEAKMAENLYFFSLNKSPREWAEEILRISQFERNNKCIQEIQSNGYDIKKEVLKLQFFLEGI